MIPKGYFKATDDIFSEHPDRHTITPESLAEIHKAVYAFLEEQSWSGCVGDDGMTIKRDFGTVFVTSDIHTDLLKFIQMLLSAGLVKCDNFEINTTSDVYKHVWRIEWVAENTLLVITGDLVDGRRASGGQVTDPQGSYEMLLHILLFNLRISARQKDSDILFTIGNHDIRSVLLPEHTKEWRTYTSEEHLQFAPSTGDRYKKPMDRRADMLAPFYLCSPYLMLRLGSALFTHGGLMHETGKGDCVYRLALQAQGEINAAMKRGESESCLGGVRGALRRYREALTEKKCVHITEARGYAESKKESVCKDPATTSLKDMGVELVVVGHCVTHHYPHLAEEHECKSKVIDGEKDSEVGCVAEYECEDGPRIVLVDVGLSECFRGKSRDAKANANRQTEMLKMELGHESNGNVAKRAVAAFAEKMWYVLSIYRATKPRAFSSHV
jgi:hypothetical protein